MEQSTSYPAKTGPIHLPKDGRSADVQVRDLVKTFDKFEAVKSISFTIGKGEIFGLLGPNGAGKSTTINMMCGYLKPTSGDTIIDGLSITREPRKVKRIIGVVPQEIALYKDLSSLENLEFLAKFTACPGKNAGSVPRMCCTLLASTTAARNASKTSQAGCSAASIWRLPCCTSPTSC